MVSSVDYTYWYPYEISFDAEGQLTSAVNYVTSDTTQTVYTLSGHGEGELPEAVSGDLAKANLTVSELNLLMEGAVPGDASLVLIYAPAADLTADEAGLLEEYIARGRPCPAAVGRGDGAGESGEPAGARRPVPG